MSTKQLLDRWSANQDRPHWIQENRQELMDATGLDIPYRLHEIDAWLTPGRKGAITRKLRKLTEPDDTDTDDTEEPDDG